MAGKKPLVLTLGKIEQLQATDYLLETDVPSFTNGEATGITKGQVVYIFAAGSVKKANSAALATMDGIGLVADDTVLATAAGGIQTTGTLTGTTTQWDAVTGQTGGLTINTVYYVSGTTSGNLTITPPSTGYIQEVGRASSTTTMIVNPKISIKL